MGLEGEGDPQLEPPGKIEIRGWIAARIDDADWGGVIASRFRPRRQAPRAAA